MPPIRYERRVGRESMFSMTVLASLMNSRNYGMGTDVICVGQIAQFFRVAGEAMRRQFGRVCTRVRFV